MSRSARHKITKATITNGIVQNDKIVAYDQVHRFDEEGNYLANGRHGMSVAAGFKALEITPEQHAKLLEYTRSQKQDNEQYLTCPTACNYIKFVLFNSEMYGYDVVGYKVTSGPVIASHTKQSHQNENEIASLDDSLAMTGTYWLSVKTLYRAAFGHQAQKKLFQRLDNMANIFESIYSKKENKLLRHQQGGKWYYRQPTFLTLTIPLQGKVFRRLRLESHQAAEVQERIGKNLQEFYHWICWKFFPEIGDELQVIHADFKNNELCVRLGATDKFIKNNMLDSLLQNLRETYGLFCYVWKAEAQLRGEIHFHVVLDCYVSREVIKKLWWGYVSKYKLYDEGFKQGDLFKIHTIENINLWIESRPNPGSLKAEMAGYFAHRLDKHGNVLYKHNKRKRVRSIEGHSWGCSENLRYEPFTLTDLSDHDIEMIEENCVRYIPVSARNKDKTEKIGYDGKPIVMARVFITRHSEKVAEKVPGESPAQYVTTEKHYQPIREQLWNYHLTEANKIYGNEN